MAQEGLNLEIVKSSDPAKNVEPQDAIAVDYTTSASEDKTKPDVTVFAIAGDRKPLADFDAAMKQYEETGGLLKGGTTPPGFDVLKIGTVPEKLRTAYEVPNQFMQGLVRASNKPDPMQQENVLGIPGTGAVTGAVAKGAGAVNQFIASQVNTSGKLGAELGLAVASGGVGNLVRKLKAVAAIRAGRGVKNIGSAVQQTSGVGPAILRTAGATAGVEVANRATGRGATEDAPLMQSARAETILTALTVGATEFVTGILSKALGNSVGEQAVKQAEDMMMYHITNKYPQFKFSGKGVIEDYAMSSKDNLNRLIQVRVKAIRTEGDNSARQFVDDMHSAIPGGLSKTAQNKLDTTVKQYKDIFDDLFDNIDNPSKMADLRENIAKLGDEITNTVAGEFKKHKLSPKEFEKTVMKLKEIFDTYKKSEGRFFAGAEIISDLRESVVNGKFNLVKFQELMQTRLHLGESLRQNVGIAASRGQLGGVDRPHEITIPEWITNKFGIPKAAMKYGGGTTYTGKVSGLTPFASMDAVTRNAVIDFFNRAKGSSEQQR